MRESWLVLVPTWPRSDALSGTPGMSPALNYRTYSNCSLTTYPFFSSSKIRAMSCVQAVKWDLLDAYLMIAFLAHCKTHGCFYLLTFFNPFTLRDTLESIICYPHTFENTLGIKRKFTKYLKESCCLTSDQHFSFKRFSRKCFWK